MTKTTVEVFYHGSRVASHRRLQTRQRDPLVKREHMPPEHQKYLTYNSDEFSRWAMSVGPMTEKVAEYFLKSGKVVEQGYKACAGLTKLEQRYSKQRLEAACAKALAYSTAPSLRTIASILKNGLDKRTRQKANRRSPRPIATALLAARLTSGREATADAEPGNDGYAHSNEDDRYGRGICQPAERSHVQ